MGAGRLRLLLIGAITRAHGRRGEVQVLPFHPDSPLWTEGVVVYVTPRGTVPREASAAADVLEVDEAEPRRLRHVRPAPKGRLLVSLEGIGFRDEAEALRGGTVGVPPEALEETLGEGEFWHYEVPGWDVLTTDGERVGSVVRAVPAHTDLLEVRPAPGGPTFFVPVIADVVAEIDRRRGRVVIHPVEGLLP